MGWAYRAQSNPARAQFFSNTVVAVPCRFSTAKETSTLELAEIAASRPALADTRQTHLRIIEDFLQKDSFRLTPERLPNENSAVYDKMFKWEGVDKEDVMPTLIRLHKEELVVGAKILSSAISFCGSKDTIKVEVQVHCLAVKNGSVSNVYVRSSLISFLQKRMRSSMSKPNDFTFTSLLSASCMGSGALGQGRIAHCQLIQMGFDSYLHVANLYSRCIASVVISKMLYILCNRSLQSNEKTEGETRWNYIPWGALTLPSCRLLEEAEDFIHKMPINPNAVIWCSLLSSCRLHGNVCIGIKAAENMLFMQVCIHYLVLGLTTKYKFIIVSKGLKYMNLRGRNKSGVKPVLALYTDYPRSQHCSLLEGVEFQSQKLSVAGYVGGSICSLFETVKSYK
ncbi:hypothetical protein RJ641_024841 [Dillenia turbinata]|uniref:Pentatricopeptide repeat-containing protein n=1 Tax=Dillenia turbinata TaxID=194707 RepID=A0AAN8ZJJ5_9MAGN